MKTIGIVGGIAWPSTVVYYRTINEMTAARLGGGEGLHGAELVIAQTDFEAIKRDQRALWWIRSASCWRRNGTGSSQPAGTSS